MTQNLTLTTLRRYFSPVFYRRGLEYQRDGRVLSLEWEEGSETLYSSVAGSGRHIYHQEITFDEDGLDPLGDCTCPVGGNCKHVIAALIEWISRNAKKVSRASVDPFTVWKESALQQLQDGQATPYPEVGATCLLHLLVPKTSNRLPTLTLRTVKSRRLKRGGWGKETPFNLDDLNGFYYFSSVTPLPQDMEIARLLTNQSDYRSSDPAIEGDIGVLALQRLLRSGRCFYRTPGERPLVFGPPKSLSIDWTSRAGKTRCRIKLEEGGDDWVLIPTEPAWYLDPATGQCGPVVGQPCPTPLLQSLSVLPPLEEKDLPRLSLFLSEIVPSDDLPLPTRLDIQLIKTPPIPSLSLRGAIDQSGICRHLVRLRFVYAPLNLPPFDPDVGIYETHILEGKTCRVVRDPEVEFASIQTLAELRLALASPELGAPGEFDLLFPSESVEESAGMWKHFLDKIPDLEEKGWKIEITPEFRLSFETPDQLLAEVNDSNPDWFEIGLKVDYQGEKIDILPLLLQLLQSNRPDRPLMYHLGENRWLEVPASLLTPVVETLIELFDGKHAPEETLRVPRSMAHNLLEIEQQLNANGHLLGWSGGEGIRQLAEKLRSFNGIVPVTPPSGLNVQLRTYQLQGLAWLQFLREYGFNGILADDMGLGKTIQTLSYLLIEKEAGRLTSPALIVSPTSVLGNWRVESGRFTPELNVIVLHGPARGDTFDKAVDCDLIITSYPLLVRDLAFHQKMHYHSLVLDEAQAIKNPAAQVTKAAGAVRADHRICLTGTPMENHLGELWSLFQVMMPGFLGSRQQFTRLFRTPIEKNGNLERRHLLQQRVAPFVLRRTKEQVTQELPPKTTMTREVEAGPAQGRLYESLRLAMVKKVNTLLQKKGLQNSRIEILDALLKLRQVCCDPRLVKLASATSVRESAKLLELIELLKNLLEENRKILIFSQFTSMLALIEEELKARNIPYCKLTGQTRKREEVISSFQNGEKDVFLVSLKAGGVGLNLTAADTVIHYDPWWNPAIENQASDRAHRIGQEKPVFVYKLVVKGTIEERILQLQEKKQQLADSVYGNEKTTDPVTQLSAEDILDLLAPLSTD